MNNDNIIEHVLNCDTIDKYQKIHEYVFNMVLPFLKRNGIYINEFKPNKEIVIFENNEIKIKLDNCAPLKTHYQIIVFFKIYKIRIVAFYTLIDDNVIPYICDN